jgi:hypothetical protein
MKSTVHSHISGIVFRRFAHVTSVTLDVVYETILPDATRSFFALLATSHYLTELVFDMNADEADSII